MRKIFTLFTVVLFSYQVTLSQCNPAFSFSINAGSVVFTAQNTAPGKIHSWNFGDGYTGNGSTVNHLYTSTGSYLVKHWVWDSLSTCIDSSIQAVQVTVPNDCHASFVVSPDSAISNRRHFTSNSVSGSGTIISYNWYINGISSGTGSTLTLTFNPGTYNVCLTIVTSTGCTSASCQVLIFNSPPSCNVSANFNYTPSSSNAQYINFTPVPLSSSYYYLWLFGDGQTSSQPSPGHLYNAPGTYPVKMVIHDSLAGCADTVYKMITVNPGSSNNCTASFTYSVNNNWLANFSAGSNQPISQAQWFIYDAPDSIILNGVNVSYQFSDTGRYYVCLVVTTTSGCLASTCQEVGIPGFSGRYAEYIPAYPNPVTGGHLTLGVETPRRDKIKIRVIDVSGNTVYHAEQESLPGMNAVKVQVDQLKRGQYFIEICIRYKIKRSIFQKL